MHIIGIKKESTETKYSRIELLFDYKSQTVTQSRHIKYQSRLCQFFVPYWISRLSLKNCSDLRFVDSHLPSMSLDISAELKKNL